MIAVLASAVGVFRPLLDRDRRQGRSAMPVG